MGVSAGEKAVDPTKDLAVLVSQQMANQTGADSVLVEHGSVLSNMVDLLDLHVVLLGVRNFADVVSGVAFGKSCEEVGSLRICHVREVVEDRFQPGVGHLGDHDMCVCFPINDCNFVVHLGLLEHRGDAYLGCWLLDLCELDGETFVIVPIT